MLADVAASRRWDVFENCEVFTMLRDPVDQAVSLYLHKAAKRQFIESTYVKMASPFPRAWKSSPNRPDTSTISWRF